MKRAEFIKTGTLSLAGTLILPAFGDATNQDPNPIEAGLVKEFVVAGHGDLQQVKQMLAEIPNLIYARHDWGNGDFEEAIEGAGHVGNKEIANYLINEGARVNLFALTMLGKTELVKSVLATYPNLLNSIGAHGFTLLHHARIGGEESRELHDWLIKKGLKEAKVKI